MLIETSKDILWLVLAFSILLFTVFSCWVIYYIATILREVKRMVVDVRKKIELLEGVIKALKEKISQTSSYLRLGVESIETILHFIKGRKDEGGKKKKK